VDEEAEEEEEEEEKEEKEEEKEEEKQEKQEEGEEEEEEEGQIPVVVKVGGDTKEGMERVAVIRRRLSPGVKRTIVRG